MVLPPVLPSLLRPTAFTAQGRGPYMSPGRTYFPILPLFLVGLFLFYWGSSNSFSQAPTPGSQSSLASQASQSEGSRPTSPAFGSSRPLGYLATTHSPRLNASYRKGQSKPQRWREEQRTCRRWCFDHRLRLTAVHDYSATSNLCKSYTGLVGQYRLFPRHPHSRADRTAQVHGDRQIIQTHRRKCARQAGAQHSLSRLDVPSWTAYPWTHRQSSSHQQQGRRRFASGYSGDAGFPDPSAVAGHLGSSGSSRAILGAYMEQPTRTRGHQYSRGPSCFWNRTVSCSFSSPRCGSFYRRAGRTPKQRHWLAQQTFALAFLDGLRPGVQRQFWCAVRKCHNIDNDGAQLAVVQASHHCVGDRGPPRALAETQAYPAALGQAIATGLTPEGARRVPSTLIDDDDPELLPAHPQEEHATVPPTWTSAWLCLAAFAVDQGAELVGELITDETQSAILPLHDTNADCASVVQQAEKAWQELRTCVAEHGEKDLFPVCSALAQVLTALRQAPQAVPQVRQGLLIAAHLTVGGLLDPYSYAPATLQEWLYPALLLERRVSCKGYLPSVASSASEVQGLLALPCPFAAHLADARAIGDDQAQEPRS